MKAGIGFGKVRFGQVLIRNYFVTCCLCASFSAIGPWQFVDQNPKVFDSSSSMGKVDSKSC